MKYFFILGNNPALSLAEILAVLKPKYYHLLERDFLVMEVDIEIDAPKLIKRMGGVIKIGEIKDEIKESNFQKKSLESSFKIALLKSKSVGSGKFNFGISDYSRHFNIQKLGLKLKNEFKKRQISSRFVTSREENLTSVVVEQNKLIKKGIEIILVSFNGKVLVGETLAVQPFKSLSYRDFGRPARDDKSGMLPPKLAQAMINLAELQDNEGLLLDPFCGSGTILTEAMLMDYRNLFGLDSSFKAIQDSRRNVDWIKEQYEVQNTKVKLVVKNVLDLSKFIKVNSVSVIVTEPYLGPQRGKIEFDLVIKELEELYSKALTECYKVLIPGARMVMVWPVFYGNKFINPDISKFIKIELLPERMLKKEEIKKFISPRGSIIYGRQGQKVFREIIVLEK